MFFRLLYESFRRQRRRKVLAGIAILLGTTAVTAMLALATTIGDRIHSELSVYGANIVVTPAAAQLDVKIGGVDIQPATGNAYLHESDLAKLKTIFWANNITGVSPELSFPGKIEASAYANFFPAQIIGYRFGNGSSTQVGAPALHPWWKLQGKWPISGFTSDQSEVVLGSALASRLGASVGDLVYLKKDDSEYASLAEHPIGRPWPLKVTGIISPDESTDNQALMEIHDAQWFSGAPDAVSRVEISARTKPEDAFARQDPDKLSPAKRDIWYCRPYANSIAYQIQEAIPGAHAEQVRKVEQSEGTVLARISGLMWLISAAALLAASFAVSAAMATAVLERRAEIGLMRSLGAAKSSIALLFYAEASLLALIAGTLGYLLGSALAAWLGARIFSGDATAAAFNPVLLPVTVGLALLVALAGSTPSIRVALRLDPATILRSDA